jgi:hypothetical protein
MKKQVQGFLVEEVQTRTQKAQPYSSGRESKTRSSGRTQRGANWTLKEPKHFPGNNREI